MDVPRVHDDPDPQLPLRLAVPRQAGVVLGEEPAKQGDGPVQQVAPSVPLHRLNQRQDAVAPVDERVAETLADEAGRAQRLPPTARRPCSESPPLTVLGRVVELPLSRGDDRACSQRVGLLTGGERPHQRFPEGSLDRSATTVQQGHRVGDLGTGRHCSLPGGEGMWMPAGGRQTPAGWPGSSCRPAGRGPGPGRRLVEMRPEGGKMMRGRGLLLAADPRFLPCGGCDRPTRIRCWCLLVWLESTVAHNE